MRSRSGPDEGYSPLHFGKDYCGLQGSAQYPVFAATALGVKPLFDDWVEAERLDQFISLCGSYGLKVKPDSLFVRSRADKSEIIGGENITTTFHEGKPFRPGAREGEVHVFVSRSEESIAEARRFGWYPVIIKGRLINKPYMDNILFGRALGYPECCIDFFRRYNDWKRFSHPYEAFKNTPDTDKRPGSYLCNNLLMDWTFSLIHHLPCSYRCERTMVSAKRMEDAISEVEPGFVERAKDRLSRPFLVFGERHFVRFDGKLTERGEQRQEIRFTGCDYYTNPARPEDAIDLSAPMMDADRLVMDAESVRLYRKEEEISSLPKGERWFIVDFE